MKHYSGDSHVNVGVGEDIAIFDLAKLVSAVVGFEGSIARDLDKPDGTPRKLLNVDRLRELGWAPRVGLREGIAATYSAFLRAVEV